MGWATIAVAIFACADPKPSAYPIQNVNLVEDSALAPTDLLEIRVAKQDQISGDYEIDENGNISFPYAGIVVGGGRNPRDIEKDIQARLADGYLRDPQVTVRIKERHSKKISVFGEVRSGATLPFVNGMTIVEAISQAGGFTPRAWENAVKVTRKLPSDSKEFTVPVNSIAHGDQPQFYMRPGDVVYVPKSPI